MKENSKHIIDDFLRSESFNDFESIDPAKDWALVKARLDLEETRPVRHIRSGLFRLSPMVSVAAAIILAVGISFLVMKYMMNSSQTILYTTLANSAELTLPDGTRVFMNQNSALSYPEKFSRSERNISLAGEAYFEVSRDVERPFIIQAEGGAVVKVLGTSFNVRTDTLKNSVTVQVTSGKVALYAAGNENEKTLLEKNEQGVYENGQFSKAGFSDKNFLSWKTGKLVFENTPVTETLEQLERHYHNTIVLQIEKTDDLSFTSTIDNQPLTEVLDEIKLVLGLDYTISQDTVYMSYPE